MHIKIFDDMSQCTEAEVARLLPLVCSQRREKALQFKFTFGQFACLKSYVMLKELLKEYYGIEDNPLFSYNEHEKPSLKDYSQIQFNISHCHSAIAVAVSDKPIGIDIESIRKDNSNLISYTMNQTEVKQINASENPMQKFTEFWTMKEATLKLYGTGLTNELHNIIDTTKINYETHIHSEYVYTIAEFSQKINF